MCDYRRLHLSLGHCEAWYALAAVDPHLFTKELLLHHLQNFRRHLLRQAVLLMLDEEVAQVGNDACYLPGGPPPPGGGGPKSPLEACREPDGTGTSLGGGPLDLILLLTAPTLGTL